MANRTQTIVLGFFLLVWASLVVILAAAPEVYDQALRVPPGNRRAAELAFLATLSAFIALLTIGVLRRWRWTFWLIVVAFLCGLLRVPASILELTCTSLLLPGGTLDIVDLQPGMLDIVMRWGRAGERGLTNIVPTQGDGRPRGGPSAESSWWFSWRARRRSRDVGWTVSSGSTASESPSRCRTWHGAGVSLSNLVWSWRASSSTTLPLIRLYVSNRTRVPELLPTSPAAPRWLPAARAKWSHVPRAAEVRH